MSVYKVNSNLLFFRCPVCAVDREISFGDLVVNVGKELNYMQLPPCSCGASSCVAANSISSGGRHDIRRIVWKRAVAAGNFADEQSESGAAGRTAEMAAFYDEDGRGDLRAIYNNDDSVLEIVRKDRER